MSRMVAVLALGALLGCGAETGTDEAEEVPADTVLAEALTLVFLAEARADATGEPLDSLRAVAWDEAERATGLDSTAANARLEATLRHPEQVEALFGAVAARVEGLRR